jgi:hypothetical protein
VEAFYIKKPAQKYFYIKIILSGCVIGTPVNFGGMTGGALAWRLFFFGNRAIKFFQL